MLPERYVMVLLCAVCTLINYADRVNMSVAIIPLSEAYSFPLAQQSLILSSFFLGYLPMQIGGAVLCRRLGGKRVLSAGAALWSLFTILTPLAARAGLPVLLACRVCMGLAEGVAFPSVYHFLSAWIPAAERARSIALFLTGAHVGTTLALVISPIIIRDASWELIFYSFGAAGFVWIALWQLLAYDKDRKPPDYAAIPAQPDPADSDAAASPKTPLAAFCSGPEMRIVWYLLSHRASLAVCAAQTMFAMVHYVILSWLPTYFKEVYHVKTSSLSFTFLPYFSMAVSANVGGFIADRFLQRGMPPTRVRNVVTILANTGASLSLIAFAQAKSVTTAIAFISMSMAFMSLNSGGFESSYLDMAPPGVAGLFKATCNTLGSFAGFVAIPFSTMVLKWLDGSWRGMFASLTVWYVVKTAIFCTWSNSDRILTDEGR